MAAKEFNDWVKGDVAIEIIGKMIAEESKQLDDLLDLYESRGIDENDNEVQHNDEYQQVRAKLDLLNEEIDAIHAGIGVEEIFVKVHEEYAPYIKARYSSVVAN